MNENGFPLNPLFCIEFLFCFFFFSDPVYAFQPAQCAAPAPWPLRCKCVRDAGVAGALTRCACARRYHRRVSSSPPRSRRARLCLCACALHPLRTRWLLRIRRAHLRSAKNCMCATPQPLCSASSGPNPRGQCRNAARSGARAKLAERGRWGGVGWSIYNSSRGAAHIQFFATCKRTTLSWQVMVLSHPSEKKKVMIGTVESATLNLRMILFYMLS